MTPSQMSSSISTEPLTAMVRCAAAWVCRSSDTSLKASALWVFPALSVAVMRSGWMRALVAAVMRASRLSAS